MNQITITPSDVLEYNFCPRFIYFMYCLCISQNEDSRYKVVKGREIHEYKSKINKEYLRKKLNVRDKKINVYMKSNDLRLRGEVDEILFLHDNTAAVLDYKYAEYKEKLFTTYKIQIVQYSLLVEEIYQLPVNKGYICFTRSDNYLHEINISISDKQKAKDVIKDIFDIIVNEKYPKSTTSKSKCLDCCYRNICVK